MDKNKKDYGKNFQIKLQLNSKYHSFFLFRSTNCLEKYRNHFITAAAVRFDMSQ